MVLLKNTLVFISALVSAVVAPLLGLAAAGIGTWHALVAGSIFYMPLGLIIMLMGLAILHSHNKWDLWLLGLLVVGAATWYYVGGQDWTRMLGWAEGLAVHTELLAGLLVLLVMALVLVYVFRFIAMSAARSRQALASNH